MSTTTLYSANDLAKRLLPGSDFDTANAFAISHVSAAIENLAEWKSLNSTSARIDHGTAEDRAVFGSHSVEP